jgi:hypothetical protein
MRLSDHWDQFHPPAGDQFTMALKALLTLLDSPVHPDRNEATRSTQNGWEHIPSQNVEPRRFSRRHRGRSLLRLQPEIDQAADGIKERRCHSSSYIEQR